MYNSPFSRNNRTVTPAVFKDNARNAIYQQLPTITSTAASIRSAPNQQFQQQLSFRSTNSSIFSKDSGSGMDRDRRSVRSAPSIYSSSTATIPEDLEPFSITVEQLVNDIVLHEEYYREKGGRASGGGVAEKQYHQNHQNQHQQHQNQQHQKKLLLEQQNDRENISLGSDLSYQAIPEMFIDWNLNVTRSKLILTDLPSVSSADFQYGNTLPQLVGDLANACHIILISPTITDKELIYTLFSSNIYCEHELEYGFKKSVAEISVKQSRLLQINSTQQSFTSETFLKLKFKKIAVRNYLINLAAAATTSHEYKARLEEMKKEWKMQGKGKLTKDTKAQLWNQVRSEVFKRAGLES
jgi:hypothetical protein